MGLLDSVMAMAGGGGQNAQVAGGLMQELQQNPGGFGSLLSSFQQNGMGNQVQQWSQGQTAPAAPGQIQQGMGSGFINSIAQRTGLSPTVVESGLAVAVPLIVHHLVSNGHVDQQGQQVGPQPEAGGMLSSILSRI